MKSFNFFENNVGFNTFGLGYDPSIAQVSKPIKNNKLTGFGTGIFDEEEDDLDRFENNANNYLTVLDEEEEPDNYIKPVINSDLFELKVKKQDVPKLFIFFNN